MVDLNDSNFIDEESNQDDIFDSLIKEFSKSRNEIYSMIEELDGIMKNVKELFPEKFDARYRMVFQERVKAVTELFKACLDMRKEITKNIKEEIELRRKVGKSDSIENIEEILNIASMAEKIEDFQSKVKISKKKVNQKHINIEGSILNG